MPTHKKTPRPVKKKREKSGIPASGSAAAAKSPSHADCVIFDMDNVLIDTRKSYLAAIRHTVDIYLTEGQVPYFKNDTGRKKAGIVSANDVHQFKLLGGFNDDWDCCYALLIYLTSLPVKPNFVSSLKKNIDIKSFAAGIRERPLRVNGIVEKLGRPSTVTIEKIARIFQEIYLGKELFKLVEHKRNMYWKKRGLILQEKPIFRKSTLEKLKQKGVKLAVATGRPRFEALFALRHFGLTALFDAVTAMDEVKQAEAQQKVSLRKPHPFSILRTAEKIGSHLSFFYVGDLPDDILAANQAKEHIRIKSVAFPSYHDNPAQALKEMERVNPDLILKKPSDLTALV